MDVCVCVCACVLCAGACVCVKFGSLITENLWKIKGSGCEWPWIVPTTTVSPMCATDGVTLASTHAHHTHLDPSRTTLSFKRDLSAHVCGPTNRHITPLAILMENSTNTYSSSWQQLHISVNNFPVSNHLELQNQIWMIWHIISKMQVMVNTNV